MARKRGYRPRPQSWSMGIGVWRLPGLVAALCRCAWRSADDTDNRKNRREDQEGHLSTFPTCRRFPTCSGACRFGDNTRKGAVPVIPKANGASKLQTVTESTKRATVRRISLHANASQPYVTNEPPGCEPSGR